MRLWLPEGQHLLYQLQLNGKAVLLLSPLEDYSLLPVKHQTDRLAQLHNYRFPYYQQDLRSDDKHSTLQLNLV